MTLLAAARFPASISAAAMPPILGDIMTEMSIIGQLAASFGAPGLLVGFMIWSKQVDRSDRRQEVTDRLEHDKARLEADKAMSASLAALTAVIQQVGR